jgi:hypothetical protein
MGRRRKAASFHELALLGMENLDRLDDPDAVLSNTALAAIAYADALTALIGGVVNQKDHASAANLLRDTLGAALPPAEERRFDKLIGRKTDVQYGARLGRAEEARQSLAVLDEFAA